MIVAGKGRWPVYYTIFIEQLEREDGSKRWNYNGALTSDTSLDVQGHYTIDVLCKMLELTL
jgi:hypothetical protein